MKNSKSKIDYKSLGIDGVCLRCSKNNHLAKNCRVDINNLKCTDCNKNGHVGKVCIRTLMEKKLKSNVSTTNYIKDDFNYYDYGINKIVNVYQNDRLNSKDSERFYTYVEVEGKTVQFEVDSG